MYILWTWGHCTIVMELQQCALKGKGWPWKALRQSEDNRQGRAMDWVIALVFLGKAHFGMDVCTIQIRLLAIFNPIEYPFLFRIFLQNFVRLLSRYLSVCMQKEVSGGLVFHVDFGCQSWQKITSELVYEQQEKRWKNPYLVNEMFLNHFNFNFDELLDIELVW